MRLLLALLLTTLERSGGWLMPTPARHAPLPEAWVVPPPAPATASRSRSEAARMVVQLKPTPAMEADTVNGVANGRVGVLLLNLGGPDTLDDVEPFLYNLFSDPEIVTLPSFLKWLNGPIATLISKSRASASKEGYASIGGGSPQLATTIKQGQALERALADIGVDAKSYVAMRYWSPFTSDALAAIKADGIQRLVVLPLYPQFSISTSGSSLRILESEFYADQELRQVKNTVIPAWYNRQGYVEAMARLVAEKIDKFDEPSKAHVFFSAHGLPVTYIEDLGDPYKAQTEASARFVMRRLQQLGYDNDWTLAYQSRVGPVEWLKPYTDDTIRELGEKGIEDMVVVPVSFVSEHIETLEEIDMEYRELAEECGVKNWERVPALGLETDFIADLARAVAESLPKMDERPLQEINEGRPVSLRVVNDLIELKAKDNQLEFGPVRYAREGRVGLTRKAEVINGRIAMAAITAASAVSIAQGTIFDEVIAGRLPQSWF